MILKQYISSVYAADSGSNNLKNNELTEINVKDKNNHENKDVSFKTLIEEDIKKHLLTETGKDRLKSMFSTEKSDKLSPQVQFIGQTAMNTGIITGLASYMFGARASGNQFLERYAHKTFNTKFNAHRAYNDIMVFGGLRFGLRMGVKAGCFTWIFLFTSQIISTYRNKNSVVDYSAAGAFTCGLLRMNLGLRGIFAGGVIGAFFGLVGGSALVVMVKLKGLGQEKVHYDELYDKYSSMREFSILSTNMTNDDFNSSKIDKDKKPTTVSA